MKKKIIKIVLMFTLCSSVTFVSCSLDPKLTEEIDFDKSPIKNDAELGAATIGIYALMKSNEYYGNNIIAFSEVRSDNAYSNNATNRLGNVSGFGLTPTASYAVGTWTQIYKVVSASNRVIEASYNDMGGFAQICKGEAHIIRALAHYDLLKNYGEQYVENGGLDALGVPYVKKYGAIKTSITRSNVAANRVDIYEDLDRGIELLKNGDQKSKVKVTLATAYGIKARAALFFSNWDTKDLVIAKENAKKAMELSRGDIISRSAFKDTYKADDPQNNSIFEIKFSGSDNPGTNSLYYVYNSNKDEGYGPIVVNFKVSSLFGLDAPIGKNEANDIRADIEMIDNNYRGVLQNIGKYVKMASNIKVLRYEEMLLTFIEADFRQNNQITGESLKYFNDLRAKRLVNYEAVRTYSLEDIRIERQKELLFEGFGFEDAMRFRRAIKNPRITGGIMDYGKPLLAFPIPQSEINASGIKQNRAY
ncbi:RagB/SusD family nutrient uptake outer membrane protein [Myroides sp. M-43]|uniref:RagB/SusD family nutrient uptake outer membrane protein n=1 Tax=Myroides oncorhynchi TaxID=2893756 RepID=UPI001E435C31|nr:RagB/SusD family nutrient uptake outer membrane protein [Myroides oncorhynchi]MCC9041738.1 RagB/SusD family nutrient uptake outer membrane protein [Myroides oncorhynchi]